VKSLQGQSGKAEEQKAPHWSRRGWSSPQGRSSWGTSAGEVRRRQQLEERNFGPSASSLKTEPTCGGREEGRVKEQRGRAGQTPGRRPRCEASRREGSFKVTVSAGGGGRLVGILCPDLRAR
jgi:hypothetical protein